MGQDAVTATVEIDEVGAVFLVLCSCADRVGSKLAAN